MDKPLLNLEDYRLRADDAAAALDDNGPTDDQIEDQALEDQIARDGGYGPYHRLRALERDKRRSLELERDALQRRVRELEVANALLCADGVRGVVH